MDDPATAGTFLELHEKIERLCELVYVGYVKIVFALSTFPALFASIFNYFILDLNDESFVLITPILYVKTFLSEKEQFHFLRVACDFF